MYWGNAPEKKKEFNYNGLKVWNWSPCTKRYHTLNIYPCSKYIAI